MQESTTLKVMTLNLAHGRKDAWHQALLKRATIQANLDEVVRLLQLERPDVVALQEADAPSLWSGRFHHVAYLSEKTGIPHFVLGEHVRRMRLAYGTALVSRHPLQDATSHCFSPSPPTPLKGIIVGTIHWPGKDHVLLDMVSVHLDFSRRSIRQRQAREIIDRLARRQCPLVLMGDFNCSFCAKDSTMSMLARELNLHSHEPLATDMVSFLPRNKRFDWIMISSELDFLEYRTLPNVLSDHRAVTATLRLARRQAGTKSFLPDSTRDDLGRF